MTFVYMDRCSMASSVIHSRIPKLASQLYSNLGLTLKCSCAIPTHWQLWSETHCWDSECLPTAFCQLPIILIFL